MKQENSQYFGKDNNFIYISLAVGILCLILSSVSNLNPLRNAMSYVFEPITKGANVAGSNTREYFSTFIQLGKFRKEYNQMKAELYTKEAEYSKYLVLKSENDALKQQLEVSSIDGSFVMANVLRDDDVNSILIDEGSKSEITQGDVVTLGNAFVGIVTNVDAKGSRVRLATDSNSHLEVVIMKPGEESRKNISSRGVAVGSVEGIRIENIAMNSNAANGDVVYVNDSKIGGFWTLGYLVGLSENPASTYKTAFVSTVLDYDDLTKVFVKLN